MPALTMPACGVWSGSTPVIEAGIESSIAKGGKRRGWSDYDTPREMMTLVFGQVTPMELSIIRNEYFTNRLTGGMTIRVPWVVKDWALTSNGASATTTGDLTGYPSSQALRGNLDASLGFWNSSNLTGARQFTLALAAGFSVDEILIVNLRDAYLSTGIDVEGSTFTLYGMQAFQMFTVVGGTATAIAGTNITGNNKIVRRFPVAITAGNIRVDTTASPDGYARIVSLQANSYTYTADYVAEPEIDPLPGSLNSRVTLRMRT